MLSSFQALILKPRSSLSDQEQVRRSVLQPMTTFGRPDIFPKRSGKHDLLAVARTSFSLSVTKDYFFFVVAIYTGEHIIIIRQEQPTGDGSSRGSFMWSTPAASSLSGVLVWTGMRTRLEEEAAPAASSLSGAMNSD